MSISCFDLPSAVRAASKSAISTPPSISSRCATFVPTAANVSKIMLFSCFSVMVAGSWLMSNSTRCPFSSSGKTTNILSISKSLPIIVVTPAGTLTEDTADSGSSLRIFITSMDDLPCCGIRYPSSLCTCLLISSIGWLISTPIFFNTAGCTSTSASVSCVPRTE